MKKTLLFVTLLIGTWIESKSQCTIAPTCSMATIGYCTSPVENSSLPNATESTAYNTTLQFSLGTTVGGVATISDATITTVLGMPTGFTYSTNPTNGTFLAGSNACLIISGTPAAASAGIYTISVGFNVNTNFGPTTQTLIWYLTVSPNTATSIKFVNSNPQFFLSPNPVTNELSISSASHIGKIQIIDALGKTVISEDANYSTQTKIQVGDLTNGVYFIQVSDGTNVTRRKFIKE